MKKTLLYILLLTTAVAIPQQGTDVGKLLPVEVVRLDKAGDLVLVSTDVGAGGVGATVKDAIENMKATTAYTALVKKTKHRSREKLSQ